MLALAILATSVFWKVASDAGLVLYLVPGLVWRGQVWQLLTWIPAAAPSTGSVVFSALIVWMTGGQLEAHWGRARFLRFSLVTVFAAGLGSALIGLGVSAVSAVPFFGGNVLSAAVWIAYGCVLWNRPVNLFGYPLTGRTFAFVGVALAAFNAVFTSPVLLVAEAFGILFTFAYARWGFPTEFLIRFGSWRLDRELKKRSAHLRSLDGGRNTGQGSDKYLQ